MTKRLAAKLIFLFSASGVLAQADEVSPGPPSVEVVGMVDANIVNPVETNEVPEYRV